jgi:4-hydroxy-tetrahydrodipicolinate synthase
MTISKLSGLIPPLVTPMTDAEDIDEQAMRGEIRHLIDVGVHGLTIGGSSGEGEKLSIEESCELARIAVDEANGAVPVIMGIIRDSTRDVIRYGQAIREVPGVSGLQITPVHYSRPPRPEGMLRYYQDIGEAVQMPIVIYNVVRWNMIDVSTLMELANQEWVVAVKQSAGDIERLSQLLERVHSTGSSLRVLSAIDTLLFPTFVLGAHGSVASILTVLPRLTMDLWNACVSGDYEKARQIHERIVPVVTLMRSYSTDRMSCMKALIEVQGRNVGPARRPDLPLSSQERELFRQAIEASGEIDTTVAAA